MKKIHLLALFLLLAGTVSAQYYDPNAPRRPRRRVVHQQPQDQVQIGFEAGLNTANIVDANNSYRQTNTISGFNAGITFDAPIAPNFSFAPEVIYSQKGYYAEYNDGSNLTQHFNFIDVPLLAKFKLAPGFDFLIGPQISFLVSSNQNVNYGPGTITTSQNTYNYNGNNTFIDGVVGLQFDITRNFDIHGRYAIDFNQTNSSSTVIPEYRNQVWQFGFGIKFN